MTQRDAACAGYAPYPEGEHPPYEFPRYASSTRRAPKRPLFAPPRTLSELTGPVFSAYEVQPGENDLARGPDGAPVLGQLMIVTGRVLDEAGRPVPGTLVELWQAKPPGSTTIRPKSSTRRSTSASRVAGAASPTPRAVIPSPRSSPAPIRSSTPATGGARRKSTSRCSARPS